MPNWHEILSDVHRSGTTHDITRRKYILDLHEYTNRNIIIYYSGWLQKPRSSGLDFGISDADKNGFMTVIHKLDRTKGLDLLLHTPGGDMAATESLIAYLRSMFGNDIRAIIPQIAMSGGAMIACACKELIMGEQSNIGPFDPQIGGTAAQAVMGDLKRAANEMCANPASAFVWQPILQKYNLGFFAQCENAIAMADEVVKKCLTECMFNGDENAQAKAESIVTTLGSHAVTRMHARHIHRREAQACGLKVLRLEEDPQLQDLVLSIHHAAMITFEQTPAYKIIENHNGTTHMGLAQLAMPQLIGQPPA